MMVAAAGLLVICLVIKDYGKRQYDLVINKQCAKICSVNAVINCSEFIYQDKYVLEAVCAADNEQGFTSKYLK